MKLIKRANRICSFDPREAETNRKSVYTACIVLESIFMNGKSTKNDITVKEKITIFSRSNISKQIIIGCILDFTTLW